MYKTSEIYRHLKIIRNCSPKRDDIYYSKEHPKKDDLAETLSTLRMSLLWTLEERGLITNEQGCYRLTEVGLSLLADYEGKRKIVGAKYVEIIPAMIEGRVSYRVKVDPMFESEVQRELSKILSQKFSQKLLVDFL
jgi:hypothetical protein